jgi:hypothetical protein
MVEYVFLQLDEFMALKERTMEIVEEVFADTNGLQKETNASNNEDELLGNVEVDHEPLGEVGSKNAMS